MGWPSLRKAKKKLKGLMRAFKVKHTKTIKKLFIFEPHPNFLCFRYYSFTASSSDNPKLNKLIEEQNDT